MNANIKKRTTKSTSRSATSVASKSKTDITEKNAKGAIKREVTTKLDEAGLDNLIRERAYFIWETEGRLHGDDVEIWLRAKKEILAQLKKSS
ncbi:DUF2934 domain-containing protein [bacterium]|nr:DUF2934 domain-containing protein [bacterium]